MTSGDTPITLLLQPAPATCSSVSGLHQARFSKRSAASDATERAEQYRNSLFVALSTQPLPNSPSARENSQRHDVVERPFHESADLEFDCKTCAKSARVTLVVHQAL